MYLVVLIDIGIELFGNIWKLSVIISCELKISYMIVKISVSVDIYVVYYLKT